MATDVIMPVLGVAQDTGRVIRWLASEGDLIRKGQPLIEVETDKVTVELEAAADGTLAALTAQAGDDVPVGRVIGLILAAGETAPDAQASPQAPGEAASDSPAPPRALDAAPGRPAASPLARRLAAEAGVDLAALAGRLGRPVQAADVRATGRPEAAPDTVAPAAGPAAVTAIGSGWRTMAERTLASWTTTPHFAVQRELDASRLVGWQRAARAQTGLRITITDLIVRSAARALRDHPALSRSWSEAGLVTQPVIGVGLAVALDDGLVVPVIHEADRLDLPALAARRAEIVQRAREGRLEHGDVQGGTFTVSNLGMYGIDAFTAIINPPQAAILAVGRIADRVQAIDGRALVRPGLTLTLSCDHRVLDGARAGAFMDSLAGFLEEPASLVA